MVEYTNAPVIINDDFRDSEDLDGLFSGWKADGGYATGSWQYKGMDAHSSGGEREAGATTGEQAGHGGQGATLRQGEPPCEDRTLQHPRCVYQLLRAHYARYTPEFVEDVCGVPEAEFLAVCEALCDNSGRERTSAIVYAVGWTQHSIGVQIIRAAAIVQLLLGNVGRPGGGVMALRGHASIQGSTDIPTLYNILPGYIPMPHAQAHATLRQFIELAESPGGFWGHFDAYAVSLLKAYWGDAAHAGNDFCFDYLPRISGDHSHYHTALAMARGEVPGFIIAGENPAVGSANGRVQRDALAAAKWLVVRDFFEIESAAFWYSSPEIESGERRSEDIATEVFLMPAAAHTEKDGSFTNTQRLLQWHHKAIEPPGDCRSELWFYYHLGRIVREKLAARDRSDDRDRPVLDLAWDYPTEGPTAEPSAEAVLREINGWNADGSLTAYTELRADEVDRLRMLDLLRFLCAGDQPGGAPQEPSRAEPVAPEWGWAWPANRRILYNRASADPDGEPWSERKRYVWWDAGQARWVGDDVPDFEPTKPPSYVPPDGARAEDGDRRQAPVHHAGRRARLAVRPGRARRRPAAHPLRAQRVAVRQPALRPERESDATATPGSAQPLAPERRRARRRGLPLHLHDLPADRASHGGRHEPVPALPDRAAAGDVLRGRPELARERAARARRMGDDLDRARRDRGPRHGHRAHAAARVAGQRTSSDRPALPLGQPRADARATRPTTCWRSSLDPNVHIQESKVATCDIRPGRRPEAAHMSIEIDLAGFARDLRRARARACRLLHRHDRLHRLQGVRGRVQGVEPRSRRRLRLERRLLRQHRAAGRRHLEARRLHRAGRPLRVPADGHWRTKPSVWLMSSDVCKHCTHAACLEVCPTGALFRTEFGTVVVQDDVCNGCGYCVPACPFGVIDRRERDGDTRAATAAPRSARSATTACGTGMTPACAKACPTESIQFGPLESCARAQPSGSPRCRRRARERPPLRRRPRATASAGSARSSSCSTSPRCTACRPTRSTPPATSARCGAVPRRRAPCSRPPSIVSAFGARR